MRDYVTSNERLDLFNTKWIETLGWNLVAIVAVYTFLIQLTNALGA